MAVVDEAVDDGDVIARQVRSIATAAWYAAMGADALISAGGLEGGLTIRLIEASHALHRTWVVLADERTDARASARRGEVVHPWHTPTDGNGRVEGHAAATGDESARTQAEERGQQPNDRGRTADDMCQSIVQQVFEAGLLLQGARTPLSDPAAARIEQALELLEGSVREIRVVMSERVAGND